MFNSLNTKVFALSAITLTLAACNSDDDTAYTNPGMPAGVSTTAYIAAPALSGSEVAVVEGNIPVTNAKSNIVAYDEAVNPILQILSGFNSLWSNGDTTWLSTGSDSLKVASGYESYTGVDGGGTNSTSKALLLDFGNEATLNADVWQYNFDYVKTLTRPGETTPDVDRTDAAAQVFAYLDDQREKGYSITSGLGALAEDYRIGANANSTYSYSADGTKVYVDGTEVDIFDQTHLMNDGLGSGTNYGETGYELDAVVTLLQTIADYGASTEAPKYHFESPRPWRMESDYSVASYSDIGDVTQLTCYELDGTSATKFYDFPQDPIVSPLVGLRCAGRQIYTDNGDGSFSEGYTADSGSGWVSGRAKDGAFPSGHTTEAIDRGLGLAYAIPERFAEMAARSVDLGTNRIVAGMHSPLDVIGGRIMGIAVTAAALNANPDVASAAVEEAQAYFLAKAQDQGFDTVSDYAQSDVTDAEALRYADHAAMKARYKAALTYGFDPLDEDSAEPEVPEGAEALLASRFPYLDATQRRAVLATTEIDSNYPVIDQSRGWGRLNLVEAADGYGAFTSNVAVVMDADDGTFSAQDHWLNDISGAGRLEKSGTGALYLAGDNSYSGGTLVEQGTLVAASASAFGAYTLYQADGTVLVSIDAGESDSSAGGLTVSDFVMAGGELALDLVNNASLTAEKGIYLTGDSTALSVVVPTLTEATRYSVLSAKHLEGTFGSLSAVDEAGTAYAISASYSATGATITVTPQA
ncbi:phosphatase PAP2 family protein [Pseudaeromonas sp. ZJS20]|uniref:phosphatase PAP2 family protein n=1 Tax=Pseudaeromonas aegiceratis TaxID=3153928 RepID=UPI00390CD062